MRALHSNFPACLFCTSQNTHVCFMLGFGSLFPRNIRKCPLSYLFLDLLISDKNKIALFTLSHILSASIQCQPFFWNFTKLSGGQTFHIRTDKRIKWVQQEKRKESTQGHSSFISSCPYVYSTSATYHLVTYESFIN